jgi:hypothetical protein
VAVDLAIISPLDTKGLTVDQVRGTGFTKYIFQPYANDIQFDNLKLVRHFTGTEKLIQSLMRIIIQPKGSYFEDPEWGGTIDDQVGNKMDNERIANTRQSVIDSITHYNEVNADNPNSDEIVDTIDELRVVEDLDDPRVIRVYLGITTESGLSIGVTVPQVE